jgi:hypothetical protein
MAITPAQLKDWLREGAPDWEVVMENDQITQQAWADPSRRARYLSNRANVDLHHVHDEPGGNGFQTVYFGIR